MRKKQKNVEEHSFNYEIVILIAIVIYATFMAFLNTCPNFPYEFNITDKYITGNNFTLFMTASEGPISNGFNFGCQYQLTSVKFFPDRSNIFTEWKKITPICLLKHDGVNITYTVENLDFVPNGIFVMKFESQQGCVRNFGFMIDDSQETKGIVLK